MEIEFLYMSAFNLFDLIIPFSVFVDVNNFLDHDDCMVELV